MREILFRGKCIELGKHQGQWLEGFYGEDDGRSLISHSTDIGLIGYACDSDTIGQYTGLKDKNGKRIFEGDILIYVVDGEYDVNEKYLVVFDDDEAAFRTKFYCEGKYMCYEDIIPYENFEIIGNIYDNKNLLKNQEVGE